MAKAKKFLYSKVFEGEPKEINFKLVNEDVPNPKPGQILVEAEYWSVDPYMRVYVADLPIGSTMVGSQVGKIIQSKAKNWPEGNYILGYFGWRTLTVVDPTKRPLKGFQKPCLLEEHEGLPISLSLGVLGMPGNAAYFGLLEVCHPNEGDTVVVSGAGGAVGSTVGQIAKILGCRVIGFTGSDIKVDWLKTIGFDAAFNYKTKDISQSLREAAPKGVDCYFDNVGGDMADVILTFMNAKGRVALCGGISTYNQEEEYRRKTALLPGMENKDIHIEEFSVFSWDDRWQEGLDALLQWIREGKIQYRETITEGFENIPKAFINMLSGGNIGKAIIKTK